MKTAISTLVGLFLIVAIFLISYFTTKIMAIPVELVIAFLFVWLSKNDKVQHFYAGDLITILVAAELFRYTPLSVGWCCIFGAAVGTAFGIIKEVYFDKEKGQGTPSKWDAIMTGMGSVFGAIELRVTYGVLNGEGINPFG